MGKFFRKIGLLTVAMTMMLSSGAVVADDSVAANKWLIKAPTDNLGNVADLTVTTNRVKRHQTVYWAVHEPDNGDNTTGTVVVEGAQVACDTDVTEGCASAPLFIASQDALICADGDMGSSATSGTLIKLYICPSSDLCTHNAAYRANLINNEFGACYRAAALGDSPTPLGGAWIYVDVTTMPTATGDTALVWVTGQ
jgi:hypothetical protein